MHKNTKNSNNNLEVLSLEFFSVILSSVFSLLALFLLTKLTGDRQMTELTMFDYVIGISIGSIAAEMATELEKPLLPLTAMAVYAAVAITISVITSKSMKLRRIFLGHSIILMQNGILYRENFKRSHLDLNEFLTQCRTSGFFDLSLIHTAILEPSGKISFMPYPVGRPVTVKDLNIKPQSEDIFYNIIIDGKLLPKNLKEAGFDENWLTEKLANKGYNNINDIFLATLDKSGTLHLFKTNNQKQKNDYFE